jgi:hypothetical protein
VPWTRQSGQWRGKSFIGGGRAAVRSALFMGALVAVKHNRTLKAFYERLIAAGKDKMVALIAVARKLLIGRRHPSPDTSSPNPAPPPASAIAISISTAFCDSKGIYDKFLIREKERSQEFVDTAFRRAFRHHQARRRGYGRARRTRRRRAPLTRRRASRGKAEPIKIAGLPQGSRRGLNNFLPYFGSAAYFPLAERLKLCTRCNRLVVLGYASTLGTVGSARRLSPGRFCVEGRPPHELMVR